MLTSRDVSNKSFTSTQLRRGYDEREVDAFLDEVVATLRYYEEGGRPGPEAPQAPQTPRRPVHKPDSGHPLPDPQAQEGLGRRATRWLRGDPPQ